MKILTANQIHEADLATIQREPIDSLDLMERASEAMAQWICQNVDAAHPLVFLVGKGNNGGDGLALARMLFHAGFDCAVKLVFDKSELNENCRFNFERLPDGVKMYSAEELQIPNGCIVIDAIFGTGLTRQPEGAAARLISYVNSSGAQVVSVDIPSGMRTEFGNSDHSLIIQADRTLTIEFPKLAMLLPEAGECCGEVEVISIELDPQFIRECDTPFYYVKKEDVVNLLEPRKKFSHKGIFGHALLVCGSKGMAGAAALATGGALRSGCGLVTLHIPEGERLAVQANYPSALMSLDSGNYFSVVPENLEKYNAIGVGSGLGTRPETVAAFTQLLKSADCPMVLDADAINIIALNPDLKKYVPKRSVFTPHPGELKRLVGEWSSEQEKLEKVRRYAASTESTVIVKGAYSMICTPDKRYYFNSTGGPGMAKGGSGDVLTGLLAGLLSRGYSSEAAAIIGVYVHGAAGDKASEFYGVEGMNSSDIIDFLAEAYVEIK